PSALVMAESGDMRFASNGKGYSVRPDAQGVYLGYSSSEISAGPTVGLNPDGSEVLYMGVGTGVGAFGFEWSSIWHVDLNGTVSQPLVVGCDGVIYGVTSNQMFAIVSDSIGLAQSAWPRYQHDNRNSGDADFKIWNGYCID